MTNQNELEDIVEDMVVYTRMRFRKDKKTIEKVSKNTELGTSTISRLKSPGKRISALTLFTLMCEANMIRMCIQSVLHEKFRIFYLFIMKLTHIPSPFIILPLSQAISPDTPRLFSWKQC